MAELPPPDDLRREVFLALVEAQDRGVAVPESRRRVAADFGLSERQVGEIEREGVANDWPPLG
jgi:hypothetical protein